MFWLTAIGVLVITGIYYLYKINRYWTERGIKQGNAVPVFGHNFKTFLRIQSFADWVKEVYNIGDENDRYVGMYQFTVPTLVLRDPELIKTVGVKDFENFTDHRTFVPEEGDPLWGKNLFSLKGQRWRDMRSTLSPAFTSSKMKQMFFLMSESSEQFVKYFLKQDNADKVISVELKDAFTRYCTDIIASTAFGVKVDSLEDRKNQFYEMGIEATDFSGFIKMTKFFGYMVVPKLFKVLKIGLFSKEVSDFFRKIVRQTIEYREKNNVVRPDMINLLMEARKNGIKYDASKEQEPKEGFATVEESNLTVHDGIKKMTLTDDDIAGQALIFFFAGFETVSTLMCFVSYELALASDIQKRLIQEVDETNKNNPELTYEALSKMKYLDMVISETLRKWPNAVATDRICNKPYTIEPKNPGEKPLHIEKGTVIWIPTMGIHRDPRFYPNPDKFDPERFSEENKKQIDPYTYLPFGVGPRNCIGSRFALLETKAIIYHILKHFEFVPIEKTPIPLKLSAKTFNLRPDGGFWVGLKRREHVS